MCIQFFKYGTVLTFLVVFFSSSQCWLTPLDIKLDDVLIEKMEIQFVWHFQICILYIYILLFTGNHVYVYMYSFFQILLFLFFLWSLSQCWLTPLDVKLDDVLKKMEIQSVCCYQTKILLIYITILLCLCVFNLFKKYFFGFFSEFQSMLAHPIRY